MGVFHIFKIVQMVTNRTTHHKQVFMFQRFETVHFHPFQEVNPFFFPSFFIRFSLHTKWSFPLRISSVNVTKSAVSCGFGHIYWRNPKWKTSFFVKCYSFFNLLLDILTLVPPVHYVRVKFLNPPKPLCSPMSQYI